MADYIPFVNNEGDATLTRKYFADSHCARVPLESIERIVPALPDEMPLWVDATVDAYDCILSTAWPMDIGNEPPEAVEAQWPLDEEGVKQDDWKYEMWRRWYSLFGRFTGCRVLTDPKYWVKEHRDELNAFVAECLDACMEYHPVWLTVPQLPIPPGGSRNKINRMLAEAAGRWKSRMRPEDRMYPSLKELHDQLPLLANKDVAKDQLASVYKDWIDNITATVPNERALRLYEDLSRAYVLGRRLPQMPKGVLSGDGSAGVREPGKVAEQLMLMSL
jgi:hypothetical protein